MIGSQVAVARRISPVILSRHQSLAVGSGASGRLETHIAAAARRAQLGDSAISRIGDILAADRVEPAGAWVVFIGENVDFVRGET